MKIEQGGMKIMKCSITYETRKKYIEQKQGGSTEIYWEIPIYHTEYLEYIGKNQNKWKSEESEASSHGRRSPTKYRVHEYLKNIVHEDDWRNHRKNNENEQFSEWST